MVHVYPVGMILASPRSTIFRYPCEKVLFVGGEYDAVVAEERTRNPLGERRKEGKGNEGQEAVCCEGQEAACCLIVQFSVFTAFQNGRVIVVGHGAMHSAFL